MIIILFSIITTGIGCIKNYAKECGTEMIAENFQEQFEKPATFLTKICDKESSIRKGEYISQNIYIQMVFLKSTLPKSTNGFRRSEVYSNFKIQ